MIILDMSCRLQRFASATRCLTKCYAQHSTVQHCSTRSISNELPLLVVDGTAAIVAGSRAIKQQLMTSNGVVTTGAYTLLSAVIKLKRNHPNRPLLIVLEQSMMKAPQLAFEVDSLTNHDLSQQTALPCSSFATPLTTTMASFHVDNHAHPVPIFYRNRQQAYPAYKAHRPSSKKAASKGFPFQRLAADVVQLTGTPVLRLPPGIEADDAIASICAWRDWNRQGILSCLPWRSRSLSLLARIETLIHGNDADFLQLESQYCTSLLRQEAKGSRKLEAVPSPCMGLYRALAGDPSDNIPGVAGFGHVRALALAKQFRTLESLLQSSPDETGLSLALFESLLSQRCVAAMSYHLHDLCYAHRHISSKDHTQPWFSTPSQQLFERTATLDHDLLRQKLRKLEFKRYGVRYELHVLKLLNPLNLGSKSNSLKTI
eukprot:m.262417 g.262417  ORF g.262417 m.262417 type:complete len:430 (+) comp17607_c0_seq4:142-1431(+)